MEKSTNYKINKDIAFNLLDTHVFRFPILATKLFLVHNKKARYFQFVPLIYTAPASQLKTDKSAGLVFKKEAD